MRIPDQQTVATSGAKKAQETAAVGTGLQGKRAGAGPEGASDQVQLSTLAEQIRMEGSESPERSARLEQLAQQVREGAYEPDTGAVAEAVIEESRRGEKG
jgi:anti-sigma28 factor (negative regulator of flagellin synthesis)